MFLTMQDPAAGGSGMTCPRCEHENRAAAKFCEECGTPLRRPEGSAHPALPYEDLQRSLTEAQEQQTATSEVLKVISRSAFDLQPVFETLVENAVRLCGAEHGAIRRFDGERLHAAAQYNASPQFEAYFKENPIAPGRGSAAGRAALERQTIHIEDALSEPEYTFGVQHLVDPIRSVVAIPMVRAGALLGVITIHRYEVRPFTDKQIALLQTFADQAVIAIENARLLSELHQKNEALTQAHAQVTESLEQQTATSEILRVISSSPTDVQPVFEAIAVSAARLCAADDGTIFRVDGEKLVLVAHEGPIPALPVGPSSPLTPGRPSARAVLEARTIHVVDLQGEVDEYPEGSELARNYDFRTVLCVPLIRAGAAIGVIAIRRTEARPFTERQADLLKAFAEQAVIAIENARLFKELEEKNRALTAAHAKVTESLEQQTATSEILRVISGSPTNLQPVLDAVA